MAQITEIKPDSGQGKELSAQSIPLNNPRNIYSLYTSDFSNLSPTLVKFYLESARKGLNFWKALLFDELRRRDSHIGAVCQTRKLAPLSSGWHIECEDEALKEEAEMMLQGFNMSNFITDIVESAIQGVSVFEVDYIYDSALGTVPAEVRLVPNHLVMYDDPTGEYRIIDIQKADALQMQAMASGTFESYIDTNRIPQVDVNPLKLLEVHSFDGNSQNGLLNGCIDSLIWAYLFKSYGVKDWASYLERYASPLRVGSYDPMTGSAQYSSLVDAVKNLGFNSYAVLPNTAKIEYLSDSNSGNSSELFNSFTDYWNQQASIRVLGQTLTTQMQSSSGSYAAAKVHDQVRHDILTADRISVRDAVNALIRRVMDMNHAKVTEYPCFEWNEDANIEALKLKSELYINLNNLGYKVSAEQIEEEFGIEAEEVPEKKEEKPKFSEKEADSELDKIINDIWKGVNE